MEVMRSILSGFLTNEHLKLEIVTLDFITMADGYPTAILADIISQSTELTVEKSESWEGIIEEYVERARGLRRLRLCSTRIENGRWGAVRRIREERGILITGFE